MTERNREQTPVVWVIQEGKNDYSSAENFGTVEFITDSDITAFKVSNLNKQSDFDIRKFLSKYIPDVDYIIPSGNPMLVAKVIMSLPAGSHTLLKWDGRKGLYIPHNISPIK